MAKRVGRIGRIVGATVDETTNAVEDIMVSISSTTRLVRNGLQESIIDSEESMLESKLSFAKTHVSVKAEMDALGISMDEINGLLARR